MQCNIFAQVINLAEIIRLVLRMVVFPYTYLPSLVLTYSHVNSLYYRVLVYKLSIVVTYTLVVNALQVFLLFVLDYMQLTTSLVINKRLVC